MPEEEAARNIDIRIGGMHCENCVRKVKNALSGKEGIRSVQVDVGRARIGFLIGTTSAANIEQSIEGAGFTVEKVRTTKNSIGQFIRNVTRSRR